MKLHKLTIIVVSLAAVIGNLQASSFIVDKANSSVLIDVKATGDDFTGKLNNYTAVIRGDKTSKKPSKVTFDWDFLNLKTGNEKRDAKMISWLDKKLKGSFVLSSFTKRTDGRTWAKGEITIHGVKQVIEFPAKVLARGNRMTIRGTAVIDTRKHQLPVIRMIGLFKVDPLVTVRFTLRGTLK
ncbi:MAG: YceI family protein [Verrucomicrobiae bacterium]|nr:YceI family protein [Verrucomicrobiae bacterium]NNJ87372.1 YceI family protein [Akkermansiaceae bacterium]